ncbi:hypothetical protein QL996_09015 [Planococcus sp. APC 4015]|nr:hypothetical protein [Planococcus sp. APC 4015]
MTDHQDQTTVPESDIDTPVDANSQTEESPQYGVGPFTIREVSLAGIWLAAFVVSFFTVGAVSIAPGSGSDLLFGFGSVWTSGLGWILTIGLPTVAVFLLGLRRLSPDGIRRVGSLGIDQFASVAFSVSAVIWLQIVWETIAFSIAGGVWLRSWVIWVSLFLMLAGVVLTVFAPLIPPFAEDFRGRRDVPAHRNARPVRAVSPRPARAPRAEAEPQAEQPYAPVAESEAHDASSDGEPSYTAEPVADGSDWAPAQARDTYAPVELDDTTPIAPVRYQAFWALAPEERDVVDEAGQSIFRIGPTAWALVVEDHGDRFLVRHEDGRVGHLLDVSNVTRG